MNNNYYSKFIILVVACILIFFYSNSPQKLSVFTAEAKSTNDEKLQQPPNSFRGPNYAPFFKVNKTIDQAACADEYKTLWGNKHHGGWYVCTVFQQQHPKDCIIYSYGLGNACRYSTSTYM